MSIRFLASIEDFRAVAAMADEQKPPAGQQWIVFVSVTECVGVFNAGPNKLQIPLRTIAGGKAEIPHTIFSNLAWEKTTKVGEVEIRDGEILFGASRIVDSRIHLGIKVPSASDFYYFPTFFEVLVLSQIMDADRAGLLSLTDRFQHVRNRFENAISEATSKLDDYRVDRSGVENLTQESVKSAEAEIRSRFCLLFAEDGPVT